MARKHFSILITIEEIIDNLKDAEHNNSAYNNKKIFKLVKELGSAMNRSELSALHFAVAFHLSIDEETFQVKEIANYLKLSMSEYSVLITELKILVEEGLLIKEEN